MDNQQKILDEFLARLCAGNLSILEVLTDDFSKNPTLGKAEMTALLSAKFSFKSSDKIKAKFGFSTE